MTGHARSFLLLGILALLFSSCGPRPESTETGIPLQPIPPPDLSAAQETVKQQIEDGEARVKALTAREADPAELADAYGDLGLVYLTYSFLEASEVCFDNSRALVADDFRWSYLLGYLYQIQGRLEEAEAVLDRVIELEPGNLPALLRLGTIHLELGEPEEAAGFFEQVVAQDPDSAAGINGLGRVAAGRGDAGRAVELFERALELQPQANSIRHALGLAYRALGDRERARLNLERGGDAPVLFVDPILAPVAQLGRTAELFLVRGAQAFSEQRYGQAAEFYRRALEIDPKNFTTHKALGFCLEKLGDLAGAIAQLDEGLRSGTTGDEARDDLERSEIYRVMGGLRVLQGRDAEAIAAFERSLELDPDRLDSHLKLANALARGRRFDDALTHYDRILEEIPDHSDVLMKRATALVNLGRSSEAVSSFERAVASDPEDAMLRLRFAEALDFLGRKREAAEQRAAAGDLGRDGDERASLLMTEARNLSRAGRIEDAIGKLREILATDAGNSDARYQLASLLGHGGELNDAIEEFGRVIDDVPWHRPARHGEITALLLLGRYEEARVRLEDGIAALPRDRGLAHGLARLLAIAPVDGVRNGAAALGLAQQLHAVGGGPETTATLALANAAAGRFEQATVIQRQLLTEASAGSTPIDPLLERRLAAFLQSRPWEALSPDEIIAAMVTAEQSSSAGASR